MNSCIFRTYSGINIDLFNPKEEDIVIEDIAHALGMKARYNGHIEYFYSVAEHSVLVSNQCPKDLALCGLLHDAAEAYFMDVPTYLKYTKMFEEYRKAENNLQEIINKRYLNNIIKEPHEVKAIDNKMKEREIKFIRSDFSIEEEIKFLNPKKAKKLFLKKYYSLI